MAQLVMIAGRPSHPPGEHEFRAGALLLQRSLAQVPGLCVDVETDGWPEDESILDRADAIVIYADGGAVHPLVDRDRRERMASRVARGMGLGLMHYATELPRGRGAEEADAWIGGHYEDLVSCNPIWEARFAALPDHPVTRGVDPFAATDEWYINIQFHFNRGADARWTPILVGTPPDAVREGPYVHPKGPYPHIVAAKGRSEPLLWLLERPDGGRGFGLTGGHYHANWALPSFRTIVLNTLLWVTGLHVPVHGVDSSVTDAEMKIGLDDK